MKDLKPKTLDKTVQKQILESAFTNPELAKVIAEAVGDRIVDAIRTVDNWSFEYDLKNIISEQIFTEDFKKEIGLMVGEYIKENKDEIKKLVGESVQKTVVEGVILSTEKIAALMMDKIGDISRIY